MTDRQEESPRRPPPPGLLEAVVTEGRRRRVRAASAGAAIAVLLVAIPLVGLRALPQSADRVVSGDAVPSAAASPSAAPSPPPAAPCPPVLATARDERSLPASSHPGLDLALVPAEPPLAATVCRYGDAQNTGFGQSSGPPDEVALEGSRSLRAGLEGIPDDLAVPSGTAIGPCTLMGGPVIPYLLHLQYEDGTVWVRTSSDLNRCALVTNGAFTSPVYVAGQVEASYEAQAWVAAPERAGGPDPGECRPSRIGRAGQEVSLVPSGWEALVLCRQQGAEQVARVIPDRPAREIAALLDALPGRPEGGFSASCDGRQPVEGDNGDQLFLHWSYPQGRDVMVIPFFGCDPSFSNGSLAAQATVAQQAELLRLLGET